MQFVGEKEPLVLCAAHIIDPPILFGNISPDCKPIAVKSRRYSEKDNKFITQEVEKLHDKDAIEESRSPYRVQVLVVQGDKIHRNRMVIDYSQTIRLFTNHQSSY